MPIGSRQECDLNVSFGYAGQNWFIHFGEDPGTTPVTVNHLGDGRWTIGVGGPAEARLLSFPMKGRLVWTDHGNFFMPVQLTVAALN
jgi:hypothetical protein